MTRGAKALEVSATNAGTVKGVLAAQASAWLIRSRRVVQQGSVRMHIRSNELGFKGFCFFLGFSNPRRSYQSEVESDFTLTFRAMSVWVSHGHPGSLQ